MTIFDTSIDFITILRCFLYVLKRLGNEAWNGDGPDYPQVVFDAIKDNASYSEHLQNTEIPDAKPWFLFWYNEYLQTIWGTPIFGDVLAKMVDFLCEELQHERFKDARPKTMVAATSVSSLPTVLSSFNQATRDNFIFYSLFSLY